MRIEKEKLKVNIFTRFGLMITGFVHINPGERLQDFINDSRESFIAVTCAEFSFVEQSTLKSSPLEKKGDIILNKTAIELMEEAFKPEG